MKPIAIKYILLSSINTVMLLQKEERCQLMDAARTGDITIVERLVNIRYIDVNTATTVVSIFIHTIYAMKIMHKFLTKSDLYTAHFL